MEILKWAILTIFFMSVTVGLGVLFFPRFSGQSPKQIIQDIAAQADIQINGTRPWDIRVHNEEFYTRVLRDGSLGFGEAYQEKMWDCDALDVCFTKLIRANLDQHVANSWTMVWAAAKAKLFNLQTKKKGLEVIDKHYQIGNDLYQNMLDPTLTYSCGYWAHAQTLDEAQKAKYDLICKKLHLRSGMKVLDIGCGWGGFAKYAAENYGVHVTGITLSTNQAEYARALTKNLPVEIRIQDYRDVQETYDRVLEIGMFEHVGEKNYREFMEVVYRSLVPDGLFLLHTIGSNVSALGTDPWIDTYIFPNGHLPSVAQIGKSVEGLFVIEDLHNFGLDYDKTLMAWHQNFTRNWANLSAKYGKDFYRLWSYYLLSCAGSFRARSIQLWQVVLSKDGMTDRYVSIR
ncbi:MULTISPECIES: cyclopropane fatty acyl phospholipid synthase [Parachlamydia]|uniref:Cyclopropane-fatty-acyl-phospholipid synthase n=1 Tax=Parachlamydia acanthamoebae (strain UV7) TaxID=765952 RepID=F8KZA3_PARAV|nr:cyclopropane fatty acyl phospholipid synthase [Parachlamydia acanthamoebae]CCB86236.1 cyclopropane-fatty-acyl-phospholipid synthase [Parachlamydia acanthamoebae UV-7]